MKILSSGKMEGFVLLPNDVKKVWESNRMKDELVKFFQEMYKPAS